MSILKRVLMFPLRWVCFLLIGSFFTVILSAAGAWDTKASLKDAFRFTSMVISGMF